MLAFRQFVINRRSLPELMISDKASTYEAVADELRAHKKSAPLLDVKGQPGIFFLRKPHGLGVSGND